MRIDLYNLQIFSRDELGRKLTPPRARKRAKKFQPSEATNHEDVVKNTGLIYDGVS
jgi:hypothetical protein